MRALVPTHDPTEPVSLADVPDAEPADDEVLVQVEAFALNRADFLYLAGNPDFRPGIDAVGRVLIPAAGGTGPTAGARVAVHLPAGGAAAELVTAPVSQLAPVPDGLGPDLAAAIPLAGLAALRLARAAGSVEGSYALITGASGGVGQFLIQLLRRRGANVTALVRASDRRNHLTSLGATVIDDIHAIAANSFDVVFESVGGDAGSTAAGTLRSGSLFLWFGQASGQPLQLDFFKLFAGGQSLTLRHFVYSDAAENTDGEDIASLFTLAAGGELTVEIEHHDSWTTTNAALARIAAGTLGGKAVLRID